MPALVVAAQKVERVWVVDLERPQVEHALRGPKQARSCQSAQRRQVARRAAYLDTVVAAVDIVAEEEVARVGRVAADLKQLHQVELSEEGRRMAGGISSWVSLRVDNDRFVRSSDWQTHILPVNVTAD